MSQTDQILLGELERLFDIEQIKHLSENLLGLEPAKLGEPSSGAACARALVDLCRNEDSIDALVDAIRFTSGDASPKLASVLSGLGKELEPGTKLGQFRIVKTLRETRLGTIYLGESQGDDGVRAAVLVTHARSVADKSGLRRFLTSARASGTVESSNVATVFGAGRLEDGRGWVASEYVDGHTLADRLSRLGAMTPAELGPVLAGVLEGLSQLHERGVTHGHVAAENVYIVRTDDGVSATLVNAGTHHLGGGVNPALVACPEGLMGGALSSASDIYGAGRIAYEALTGSVLSALAPEQVDPPSAGGGDISDEWDAFVLDAMSSDPGERPADIGALRNALDSVLGTSAPKAELDQKAFDAALAELKSNPSENNGAKLEEVAAAAGAWGKLAESLGDVAGGLGEDKTSEKVTLMLNQARVLSERLRDHTGAAKVFESIIEADEGNEVARSGLEELRRSSGDPELLVEHLLEKAEGSEIAEETAAIFREVAGIFESQGEKESAFQAWLQALAYDPKDTRTARELERLGSNPEQWNEALSVLSEAVQEEGREPAESVPLYVLMGRWYADYLKRPDFAVTCYAQAIEEDPTCDAAYEGTLGLYRKSQSWTEYVGLLLQRADGTNNPARARSWQVQAAEIMRSKLDQEDEAQELLENVLREDAGNDTAVDALEMIYGRKGSWEPLVELLERRSHDEPAAAKADTLVRIAEIYEENLDNAEKAAVQFAAALSLDEGNLDALRGLERGYEKAEQWTELRENLEAQLERVATPRQRILLLERLGSLVAKEFVDYEAAAKYYERVIAIDASRAESNEALAAIYRKADRMEDAVEAMIRHANGLGDASSRIDLLLKASRTLLSDVGAPGRAVEVCERALALEPEHPAALELLARLKANAGDIGVALESVALLSRTKKDPAERAELLLRAGGMFFEAGDLDNAIQQYKEALDLAPDNREASSRLRTMYATRGDASGAAELLQRELEGAEGTTHRAALLAELGLLRRDRLEDPAGAKTVLLEALQLDPTCNEAALGLGDMAYDSGDLKGAVAFYEPLLSRTSGMDAEVGKQLCLRCGQAFSDLKEYDKAQRAYINARALDPNDRVVARRLADVSFDAESYEEAAELYASILERFDADLVGADRGRVLLQQGKSYRLAGQLKEAGEALREATQLLPQEPAAFAALLDLMESREDWDGASKVIDSRLADADADEKFDLYCKRGDLQLEKLGDREGAGKSYVSALEINPDDRNVLTKLMSVYSASKDWGRLVEVILRIADLLEEPRQLAKYYITAGSITSRELGRLDEAAGYYEQALEHDASLEKGFEGLVRCLQQQGDWDRLEDAYREHILRIEKTADPEVLCEMWDALGALLQERLGRVEDATEAYESAQQLDPGNRKRTEMLAERYTENPKQYFQRAVTMHGELLRLDPYRAESYQSLRALYTGVKRADESWCLCQALCALKMAGPEEREFFKKHRKKTAAECTDFFSEEHWFNHVLHPDQDPLLTGIFATIAPAIAAERAQGLAHFGLSASDLREPKSDKAAISQTLSYVAGVTQIELPEVYANQGDTGGLSVLLTENPSIGLGKAALAGGPAQALAFLGGRHLSYFRNGHVTRWLVSTGSALRAWLLASIQHSQPKFPVPAALATQVSECLTVLRKRLHGREADQLHSLVQKLLSAAPELDMKRWMAAVDLTADRVGFILGNDLETASAVIKASPADASVVGQKERLKELYLYSVSESYLELRQKLGVSIDG